MIDIDKLDSWNNTLLVWITNPAAAGRIVSCAKEFALKTGLELKVVSVQRETRDNWEDTLRDLEQLENAARQSQAELTVVYSDDRLDAAEKLIRSEKPVVMFAGVPDKGHVNYFAQKLTEEFPYVKLYCVDSDCVVKEYGK